MESSHTNDRIGLIEEVDLISDIVSISKKARRVRKIKKLVSNARRISKPLTQLISSINKNKQFSAHRNRSDRDKEFSSPPIVLANYARYETYATSSK